MRNTKILTIALTICICSTVIISIFGIFASEKVYIGVFAAVALFSFGIILGMLEWYPQRVKVVYVDDSEKITVLEKDQTAPVKGVLLTQGHFTKLMNAKNYAIQNGFMWN